MLKNLHIRIELSSLIMAPRKLESLRYWLLLSHKPGCVYCPIVMQKALRNPQRTLYPETNSD